MEEKKKERQKEGRKERMTEQQHWIFITEHVLQRKTYRDKEVEKKNEKQKDRRKERTC